MNYWGGGASTANTSGTPSPSSGGDGGGSFYGEFEGALTLNGTITANGEDVLTAM